uniref:DUF3800 domain-containing protein n=1 Tax=Panagrolaimus davidi TaxID=227884 RepID=A0A914PB94_9BILA
MIRLYIDDKGGKKPESIINVINAPCNAPGVLPIDEYFQLKENCLDSYRTKTSIQDFADNYQNIYAPHFHLNNSKTVKDSLNYAIESIQIQYNHLKKELKKQGALRIPCIQKYLIQIKDNAYYNSPYHHGMKKERLLKKKLISFL